MLKVRFYLSKLTPWPLASLLFMSFTANLSGYSSVRVIDGGALLSCHATFSLSQLALSCQQFLSLLVDLTLYLDFDLSKLLLFAT